MKQGISLKMDELTEEQKTAFSVLPEILAKIPAIEYVDWQFERKTDRQWLTEEQWDNCCTTTKDKMNLWLEVQFCSTKLEKGFSGFDGLYTRDEVKTKLKEWGEQIDSLRICNDSFITSGDTYHSIRVLMDKGELSNFHPSSYDTDMDVY